MWERPTAEDLFEEITYIGTDEELQLCIAHVIARLPDEIQAFATDQIRFASIGRGIRGLTWPGRMFASRPPLVHSLEEAKEVMEARLHAPATEKEWVIVLLDDIMTDPDEAQATIAHEIAHAWLNHDSESLSHEERTALFLDPENDQEVQAATLAQHWGFVGGAASPESYRTAGG